MKFFNIDLHISVIADVKNIFENLGHKVDNLNLSGHSWVMNKTVDDVKVINQYNWRNINEELCEQFYNVYKNDLDKYDAFICAYPPVFSLLYEKFNKPIIVISATRYDFPFTNDDKKLNWLNQYLSKANIIRISNNLLDKNYCEQRSKLPWKHIPSLCEYTNQKYSGTNENFVLFSKLPINLPMTINKDVLGKYSWKDLYSYKGIIHLPYNFSTMSIFEQYTANVPLVFPTKNLLVELFKRNIVLSEISFNQVIKHPASKPKHDYDINSYNNIDIIEKTIDLCDFYDSNWMPHISYFNNDLEMFNIFNNLDTKSISFSMKEKNIERKQNIYSLWIETLNDIQ